MKNKYFKSVIYALCMVIFFTLTYIFIYEGFNIKTKKYYIPKETSQYERSLKQVNDKLNKLQDEKN